MSLIEDFIEHSESMRPQFSSLQDSNIPVLEENDSSGFENSVPALLGTGFVSADIDNVKETEIFTLDRVQFQLPAPLISMQVSNNILAMALENNHILRINLQEAHDIEDIELPRRTPDNKIYKIFFDPTGKHLLVTTTKGDNYYLHTQWKKSKNLAKLKGITIESVAWNPDTGKGTSASTKEILLGTRSGTVFETELEPTDEYFKKEDKYIKEVFSLKDAGAITGIKFEQFPVNTKKYFILLTTPTRLYQIIGNVDLQKSSPDGSLFQSLFSKYATSPSYQEIPGEISHSEIHFFSKYQDAQVQSTANKYQDAQVQSTASKFCWLTFPGIYYGDLVFGSQGSGDSVIDSAQLLPYTSASYESNLNEAQTPISIAITEFHFILLYDDRVRAVCQLNDEVVYDDLISLGPTQRILGMAVDSAKNTYWVYTTTSIYELVVVNEDQNIWSLYLEKKMFDVALQYAKDPIQKDKVLTAQAEHYFSQERYLLSATYFAQTTKSFEEVVLKFVECNERDALKRYLLQKIERLRKSDLTQITIIGTWLVEIYLNKLNVLEDLVMGSVGPEEKRNYQEEQRILTEEFYAFLGSYKSCLDPKTTYGLIGSHGRNEDLLHYASLMHDYDRVISNWIQERNFTQASHALGKQTSVELYYKYSPVLMEHAPVETVNMWMRHTNLNPRNLIPALLRYDHSKTQEETDQNQAIRYLQFVVQKMNNNDPVIHNYLLTLYATQPTEDESDLLSFLNYEGREMRYNQDYALRLCTKHHRIQSCVFIYGSMGMYEEAVDLALEHQDVELARINADKPDGDEDLRKKLWLKIARYVIEQQHDVKTAMKFLQESDLLKIEDVLPFFPDFTHIDDFKEEICSALEEYDLHIEDLKGEMNQATRNAENIRQDIRELKNRFAIVSLDKSCALCDQPILTRQFYIFPCQHGFHADCLINKVKQHLNPTQLRVLQELQGRITHGLTVQRRTNSSNSQVSFHPEIESLKEFRKLEGQKEELDELVASECYLCGDIMIKSIDLPFIPSSEQEELCSWSV
ncbi:tethering complex subunit [Basidiobolus ranarum]|uniref:Tethering complex subunit n=1 Tax=Basidiobolus ranarum TaxID=34480 RepID=A0ABR2X256_9FUNG